MKYTIKDYKDIRNIRDSLKEGDLVCMNGVSALVRVKQGIGRCEMCACNQSLDKEHLDLFTYLCAFSDCICTKLYFVNPTDTLEEL